MYFIFLSHVSDSVIIEPANPRDTAHTAFVVTPAKDQPSIHSSLPAATTNLTQTQVGYEQKH